MSIRFDTSGEYLIRTSDLLDYDSPWTWMAWYYVSADTSAYTNYFFVAYETYENADQLIGQGASLPLTAQAWIGGTQYTTNPTLPGDGNDLSVSTWYHLAVTRSSDYKLRLYINGSLIDTTAAANPSARNAPNEMSISGPTPHFSNFFNGRVAFAKCWTTELSEAQIDAEQLFAAPQAETGSVYGWWKFKTTTDLNDYSVNGRNWTANGSISTEADPPDINEGEAATFVPRIIMIS